MRILGVVIGVGLVIVAGVFVFQKEHQTDNYETKLVDTPNTIVSNQTPQVSEQANSHAPNNTVAPVDDSEADSDSARFTSDFFKTLSDTVVYEHVDATTMAPSITGDAEVDAHIQKRATARGYQLRHQADESRLVAIQGQRLQPEAATSITALQAADR